LAEDELDKSANMLYKWEYVELTEEDEDKRLEEDLGKDDDDFTEDEESEDDKLFEEEAGKEEDDFTEDEDFLFDDEEDFCKDEELGFDSLDSATSEELETSKS